MENNELKDGNKLRWFLSIIIGIVLIIEVGILRHTPSSFHFLLIIILLVFGIADRFKYIKIPGFIELKEKTEKVEGRLEKIDNRINQIQNMGVSVNFNPTSSASTESNIKDNQIK